MNRNADNGWKNRIEIIKILDSCLDECLDRVRTNILKKLELQISSVENELGEVSRRLEPGYDPGMLNENLHEGRRKGSIMRVILEKLPKG